MRISLQFALMAASLSAISFPLSAQSAPVDPPDRSANTHAIIAILEGGRRVFVNDAQPAPSAPRQVNPASPEIEAAIQHAASRHSLDVDLIRSVAKVESNFNPNAISPKGAMGLMQLMPATARRFGVATPFDVAQNLDGGTRYLKELLNSYGGNLELTLAAYNAGEAAVARSGGVPNYAETRDYVRRVGFLYRGNAPGKGRRGAPLPSSASRLPRTAPIRVERNQRGELHISNTD